MIPGDERRVRPGDGVILLPSLPAGKSADDLDGRRSIYPPSVALRVIAHGRASPEAVLATDMSRPSRRWASIRDVLQAHGQRIDKWIKVDPGDLHRDLLALWRES